MKFGVAPGGTTPAGGRFCGGGGGPGRWLGGRPGGWMRPPSAAPIAGRPAGDTAGCGWTAGCGAFGGRAGADGTALGSNFGTRCWLPPGPSTVMPSAAMPCTVQPSMAPPSATTCGLSFWPSWKIASLCSPASRMPARRGRLAGPAAVSPVDACFAGPRRDELKSGRDSIASAQLSGSRSTAAGGAFGAAAACSGGAGAASSPAGHSSTAMITSSTAEAAQSASIGGRTGQGREGIKGIAGGFMAPPAAALPHGRRRR